MTQRMLVGSPAGTPAESVRLDLTQRGLADIETLGARFAFAPRIVTLRFDRNVRTERSMFGSDAHHDCVLALRRRAARCMRRGEPRKAVLALREATARDPSGASFVRLAHVLSQLGKREEALHALKQALYCFRHDASRGRARTVARLILRLDPADTAARRRAA